MSPVDTRPKIIGEVEKSVLFHRSDGDVYCIGTRQTDRYITVPASEAEAIYETISLFDGSRTLDEVRASFNKTRKNKSRIDIDRLYDICRNAGLVASSDETADKRIHDELDVMLVDLKTFELEKLYPALSLVASILPIVAVIMLFIDVLACIMLGINGESVPWNALLGDPRVILYAWIVQIPSIVLHEFAHAIVSYRFGIRPKTFSFCVFYYCSLAFYVRIPGIYFKREKERIAIWSAGVFTNIFLAAVFLLLYLITSDQLRLFASVGMIVNLGMALGNIMPFFYSDGYYILSTLLKTPNLRKKSLFGLKGLSKERLSKKTIVYWAYLLTTIGVVASVVGVQLILVGSSIISDAISGMALTDMGSKYLNVVVLIIIALIAKTFSAIQKRHGKRA